MERGRGEAACALGAHDTARNAPQPLPARDLQRPPRAHGERHPGPRRRRGRGLLPREPCTSGPARPSPGAGSSGLLPIPAPRSLPGPFSTLLRLLAPRSLPSLPREARVPAALPRGDRCTGRWPRPQREPGWPGAGRPSRRPARGGAGRGAARGRAGRPAGGSRARLPSLPALAARAAAPPPPRAQAPARCAFCPASRPVRRLTRRPVLPPAFSSLPLRSQDALGHQPQRKRQQVVRTAAPVGVLRERGCGGGRGRRTGFSAPRNRHRRRPDRGHETDSRGDRQETSEPGEEKGVLRVGGEGGFDAPTRTALSFPPSPALPLRLLPPSPTPHPPRFQFTVNGSFVPRKRAGRGGACHLTRGLWLLPPCRGPGLGAPEPLGVDSVRVGICPVARCNCEALFPVTEARIPGVGPAGRSAIPAWGLRTRPTACLVESGGLRPPAGGVRSVTVHSRPAQCPPPPEGGSVLRIVS